MTFNLETDERAFRVQAPAALQVSPARASPAQLLSHSLSPGTSRAQEQCRGHLPRYCCEQLLWRKSQQLLSKMAESIARLQQHVNREPPDVQAGFRKGRGTRDQITNIRWIIKKAREFQKNIYFCFTDYAKAFVWITADCGKFYKRWEYQATLLAS